ncbi:conserved hypothetical protein [Beggiatoa sp. PS]|nr:conserved hypothetical protein [Beggiatoa sp. PS]
MSDQLQISKISRQTFLDVKEDVRKKLSWHEDKYQELATQLFKTWWGDANTGDLSFKITLSLRTEGRSSVDVLNLAFIETHGREATFIIRVYTTEEAAAQEKNIARKLTVADCFPDLIPDELYHIPELVVYRNVSENTGSSVRGLHHFLLDELFSISEDEIGDFVRGVREFAQLITIQYQQIKGRQYSAKDCLDYYKNVRSQLPPDLVIKGACLDELGSRVFRVQSQNIKEPFSIDVAQLQVTPIFQIFDQINDNNAKSQWLKIVAHFDEADLLTGKGNTAYLPFRAQDIRIWVGIDKDACMPPHFELGKQYELIFFDKDIVSFTSLLQEMKFDSEACLSNTKFQELLQQKQAVHTVMRHNDLHCGNVLASLRRLKAIDLGDMKPDLIASDIARLEVSLWFEVSKRLPFSKKNAEEILYYLAKVDEQPANHEPPHVFILSLIIRNLRDGFKEGVWREPEPFEIELAYVIQILLYQRYCLLDGLVEISPAFNIFVCHKFNQFRHPQEVAQKIPALPQNQAVILLNWENLWQKFASFLNLLFNGIRTINLHTFQKPDKSTPPYSKLNNPFSNYGHIMFGENFVGRESIIDTIEQRIINATDPGNLAIIGAPRIGKSSLAYHTLIAPSKSLLEKKLLTFRIDLPTEVRNLEDLFKVFVLKALEILEHTDVLDNALHKQGKSLLTADLPWLELQHQVQQFFKKIKTDGWRIVAVIDEFDAARDIFKENRGAFDASRELAYQPEWRIGLVTLSRRPLGKIVTQSSVFISTFQGIFLDKTLQCFTRDELTDLLQKLNPIDLEVTNELLEFVWANTGGHPYLASALAFHIADMWLNNKEYDLEKALQNSTSAFHEYYENVKKILKEDDSWDKLLQILFDDSYNLTKEKISNLERYALIKQTKNGNFVAFSEHFGNYIRTEGNFDLNKSSSIVRVDSQHELKSNPFSKYNEIVFGKDFFVGRENIIETIEQRIIYAGEPGCLAIIGSPKMGKSSLVHHTLIAPSKSLLEKKLLTFQVELSLAVKSQENLFKVLVSKTLEKLDSANALNNALSQQGEKLLTTDWDWLEFQDQVQRFFKRIKRAEWRVVVIIDEFDAVCDIFRENSGAFDALKGLVSQAEWRICLVTLSQRPLTEVVPQSSTYAQNFQKIFLAQELQCFTRNELVDLLLKLENIDLPLTDELLEFVWEKTDGHPYLASALAFHIADMRLNNKKYHLEEALQNSTSAFNTVVSKKME